MDTSRVYISARATQIQALMGALSNLPDDIFRKSDDTSLDADVEFEATTDGTLVTLRPKTKIEDIMIAVPEGASRVYAYLKGKSVRFDYKDLIYQLKSCH